MVISSVGKSEKQFVIKITPKELYKWTPGQGINKVVYDDINFEKTIDRAAGVFSKIRTQNHAPGEKNIMLTASAVNPDPLLRKYEEDIEREMSRLKIVSDSLPESQEPRKIKNHLRHQEHIGFAEDPALDDIDSIRKHMQRFRSVTVNQAQYNRIASHMDRYKLLYGNSANKQAEPRFLQKKPERNPYSGMNEYTGIVAEW